MPKLILSVIGLQYSITVSPLFAESECKPLPVLAYGKVDVPDTILGSVATYTCNKGFSLIGDDIRICERDGWSGEAPVCKG